MDPREPTPSSFQPEVASTGYPVRRAHISLTTRVLIRTAVVLAITLLLVVVLVDTFLGRISDRLADDTVELSNQISARAGAVIERQSKVAYQVQVKEQAHGLEFLFSQTEAAVELLAFFAETYTRGGYDSSVVALAPGEFTREGARPRDMEMDEGRGMEVSWAYPLLLTAPSSDRAAARAHAARYAKLRDPMVALCRHQPHLLWAYAAFPSRSMLLVPGSALFADKTDFDPTTRGWYRDAVAQGGGAPVWQTPYTDAGTQRLTVTCAKAFRDRNQQIRGVVGVDVSLSVLQQWLAPLAGEEDFDAYLVDRAGNVVYQQSYSRASGDWHQEFEAARFTSAADSEDRDLLDDLSALRPGVRLLRRPEGLRYAAYAPLPTVDWNLLLAYPNTTLLALQRDSKEEIAAAFQDAQKTTERRMGDLRKYFMGGLIVVCAALMGAVVWTMTFRFKRPVNTIIEDIHVVSTGNLDHQIRHRSDDELGELANSFNEMTLQLRRTRDQLREYSRTLEHRVQERTAELAQRNEELNELYREAEQSYMKLKAAQSQLVQQERMATLGQLVAGIAHEINNPVNFLLNSVKPLRQVMGKIENVLKLYESADQLPDEEMVGRIRKIRLYKRQMNFDTVLADVDSALELIYNGAERTGQIVQNLRVFSRTEQSTYKPVDLRRGLDITISLLAHQLKNRVTVHKDYGDIPLVDCNPGQINQVFMNLLSNAAQAIEGEGNLWLEVKKTGRYVRIRIQDDGCGIPDEHLYRIFEPFFTTKGEDRGTGLGLSITHNIIQEHGGTIEVRSEVGSGTEFIVSLPAEQASGSGDASVEEESLESAGSTQQIPIYRSGERKAVGDTGGVPAWRGPGGGGGGRASGSGAEDEESEDTAEKPLSGPLRTPEDGTRDVHDTAEDLDED